MKPLSDQIWEAWRVGGSGWTADDVQNWMDAAKRMEDAARLREKEVSKLRARIEELEACREVLARADKNMGPRTWREWWRERAAALANSQEASSAASPGGQCVDPVEQAIKDVEE